MRQVQLLQLLKVLELVCHSMIPLSVTRRTSEDFPSGGITVMTHINVYLDDGLKPEYSAAFIFSCQSDSKMRRVL